jgi:hypothetical protein
MITYANCITALTNVGWYVMKTYTYGNYYYSKYVTPFTKDMITTIYQKTVNPSTLQCKSFRVIHDNNSRMKKIYYAPHVNAGFKFIQVIVDVNKEKYDVNIDDYMVVGNILFGDEFVKYILEDQLGVVINNEEYTVDIIDQNVNFLKLSVDDYLVIKNEGYEMVKIEHEDSDDEIEANEVVEAVENEAVENEADENEADETVEAVENEAVENEADEKKNI